MQPNISMLAATNLE